MKSLSHLCCSSSSKIRRGRTWAPHAFLTYLGLTHESYAAVESVQVRKMLLLLLFILLLLSLLLLQLLLLLLFLLLTQSFHLQAGRKALVKQMRGLMRSVRGVLTCCACCLCPAAASVCCVLPVVWFLHTDPSHHAACEFLK